MRLDTIFKKYGLDLRGQEKRANGKRYWTEEQRREVAALGMEHGAPQISTDLNISITQLRRWMQDFFGTSNALRPDRKKPAAKPPKQAAKRAAKPTKRAASRINGANVIEPTIDGIEEIPDVEAMLRGLRAMRKQRMQQVEQLDRTIAVLQGVSTVSLASALVPIGIKPGQRNMSDAGRRAIGDAARKRWERERARKAKEAAAAEGEAPPAATEATPVQTESPTQEEA